MSALFSPDSWLMQALSRIWDLVMLNLLFLLSCVPVFTIGAASAALYTVCFRMDTDREEGMYRTYFSAFRQNFKQGTLLFLLFVLFLGLTVFNLLFFAFQPGALRFLSFLFVPVLALLVLMYTYAFPHLCLFSSPTMDVLKNSLLLGIGYLPRSLLAAVLNLCPAIVFWMNLYTFAKMALLWILLYFSAAAYLNARILHKAFAPYLKA